MPYTSDTRLDCPLDVPLWSWCFDSPYSVLAQKSPSKVRGFRDASTGELFSYKQLRDLSIDASIALKKRHKLRKEEVATIFGTNSIWWIISMFSCLRIGVVVSAASPASTVDEMVHSLKISHSRLIFTSAECLETALAAAKVVGIKKRDVILFPPGPDGFITLPELIDVGKDWSTVTQTPSYQFPKGKRADEVVALLGSSSGTTGLPKAVRISHANMIAQCLQIKHIATPEMYSGTGLAILPFFHIAGLSQSIFVPFALNQEMVMVHKFDLRMMLSAIQQYRINELGLVPPILVRLAKDPLVSEYDLSSVKQLLYGAAPISVELIAALKQRFHSLRVRNMWGLTETTGTAVALPPKFQTFEYGHMAGELLAGMEMKIIDPTTGEEVGNNEDGEILVRGPNVVMGYLNNPKATAETFDADGWCHTGDLGHVNDLGLLVIGDRIKELIKVKGIQVAPAELEDLLLGHPLVADAAVIGVPDPSVGEVAKAFVILKDNKADKAEVTRSITDFVKEKKSRHKWLDGGLELVDEIPKSASGKILRRVLRDLERKRNTSKL